MIEALEVLKRSGDHLVALLALINDPKRAKAFMDEVQLALKEQRKVEVDGMTLAALKTREKDLDEREQTINNRFAQSEQLVPEARLEADRLKARALDLEEKAQKRLDEGSIAADTLVSEAQRELQLANNSTAAAETMMSKATTMQNNAKAATDKAERLKDMYEDKLERFRKATEVLSVNNPGK